MGRAIYEMKNYFSIIFVHNLWHWDDLWGEQGDYRHTSDMSRTKLQNLNVSRFVLRFSLPDLLKPGVKSRMKMTLKQRRQAMLQLHLSAQQFSCLLRCGLY